MAHHDVRLDLPGVDGHRRLTCYTNGCNEKTLVRLIWMSNGVWNKKRKKFLQEHPCDKPIDLDLQRR